MDDETKAFWRLSSRSVFVLVAIFGPLLAAYVIHTRAILGYKDALESSQSNFVLRAAFVSAAVSVVYLFFRHSRRTKKELPTHSRKNVDDS